MAMARQPHRLLQLQMRRVDRNYQDPSRRCCLIEDVGWVKLMRWPSKRLLFVVDVMRRDYQLDHLLLPTSSADRGSVNV